MSAILDHCDKNVNHLILAVVEHNVLVLVPFHQPLRVLADHRAVLFGAVGGLGQQRLQGTVCVVRHMWLSVERASGLAGERRYAPVGADAAGVEAKALEVFSVHDQGDGIDLDTLFEAIKISFEPFVI